MTASPAFDWAVMSDSSGVLPGCNSGSKNSASDAFCACILLTFSKIILCMGQKKPNPHAQALGHLSGAARAKSCRTASEIASKGGKARAESLSAARRSEIAKKAVAARERKRAQQQRKGKS